MATNTKKRQRFPSAYYTPTHDSDGSGGFVEKGEGTDGREGSTRFGDLGLRTQGQKGERQLLDDAGISNLDAGGFAKRDAIRASIRGEAQQEKRIKRATNLAYRDALRAGDRGKALAILQGAKRDGVQFGGISQAGSTEAGIIQDRGEGLLTRLSLTGEGEPAQPMTGPDGRMPEADKSVDIDEIELQSNKDIIRKQLERPKVGFSSMFGGNQGIA